MAEYSITLFFILLFLILISGFFSAAEIGMMSLNRYRLRHLVKKEHKQAIRVNKLLAHPDKLLSAVLIGNNVANIMASMVATLLGQSLYGEIGVAVATLALTIIILIFAEMAPKTLAALYPEKVAFICSLPLFIIEKIFTPIIKVLTFFTNGILKLFGVNKSSVERDVLSQEELRSVVHESSGLLPIEHKSMLIGLLDLEKARVEDILVPKSEIVGIDIELPWYEILDQLETAQHTRMPLYKGSIDNLIGVVHLRSVLNLALEEELNLENLLDIAEEPYFIPEGTPLNVQISNFQKIKKRSAFVVDEYGELIGLATMEDILEEIVGEFTTDISQLSKDVVPLENGFFIIDASVTIRNLNRVLNWHLPLIGPRTLNGLIIEHLGYIPPSDCCLRFKNYQIEILKVSGNTIKTVKMKLISGKNKK